MAGGVKGAKHCFFTLDGVALTNYVDQVDLNVAIADLATTNMGSDAEEAEPGLASFDGSVKVTKWGKVVDDVLGPLALAPEKVTAVIAYKDDLGNTVTYTWTNEAFVTGYNISGAATGKIESGPKVRLSGLPVRTVS